MLMLSHILLIARNQAMVSGLCPEKVFLPDSKAKCLHFPALMHKVGEQ